MFEIQFCLGYMTVVCILEVYEFYRLMINLKQ